MPRDANAIAELLHQAAETHHIVYADTDGEDPDWATFYADWLLAHSRLPGELGRPPVRSHLTAELVTLDRDFTSGRPDERWEDYYARRLLERFAA
jgi:hypothetical protein